MKTLAPPVARCPHCGGWLARRVLHTAEQPAVALVCGLCALDLELMGGRLVPISRPASTLTNAERRQERHVVVTQDAAMLRREACS